MLSFGRENAELVLAETNRQIKQAAQTLSGSNSVQPQTTEWDRIVANRPGVRIGRL